MKEKDNASTDFVKKDKDNEHFVTHHEKVKFLKQLEDDVKMNQNHMQQLNKRINKRR